MKEIPTIDSLARRLADFLLGYHIDVLSLIDKACAMCRDRPDIMGDAAAVIETCLSRQIGDYESFKPCMECGKYFQPAPWRQLRRSARRYVEFVLAHDTESVGLFHRCKACGGKLPFDNEPFDLSEGEIE